MHVTNALDQPITLHWHGLVQNGTIWDDGPSGVTQCPIAVGKSYTYSFPIPGDLEFGTYCASSLAPSLFRSSRASS